MYEIGACIRAAGLALQFRHVRMFLVICAEMMADLSSEQDLTDAKRKALGERCMALAEKIVGPSGKAPSNVSLDTSIFAALCEANSRDWSTLREQVNENAQALKDSIGEHVITDSLQNILARYANNLDVDSAKLLVTHIHRHNAIYYSRILHDPTTAMQERANFWAQTARVAHKIVQQAADKAADEAANEAAAAQVALEQANAAQAGAD